MKNKKVSWWTNDRKIIVGVWLISILFGIFLMGNLVYSQLNSNNKVELFDKKSFELRNYSVDVPYIVTDCTWIPQNNSYNKCGKVREEIVFYNQTIRTWQELKFAKQVIDVTDLGYYCWNTATGVSCVSSSDGAGNIKAQVIKTGMTYFIIDSRSGKVSGDGFKNKRTIKELQEVLE